MTVTVTPTVDLANVPARVRLDVSASAGETSTTINRLNPDGTQVPVRTYDGNPLALSAGVGLIYDYEMPYQQAVSYATLESPATVSAQVTVGVTKPWLIHPGVPALSVPIQLRNASLTQVTYSTSRGVFHPMGRANAVVQTAGARHGATGTMTALVTTSADLAALSALLSDAGVLLLNIPATSGYTFSTAYVSIGDVTTKTSVSDRITDPYIDVTMPFDVVDRPAGGSQAQRTYVDLLNYATYAALQSRYASYTALLSGP